MTAWCECDLWSTACVCDSEGACLTHPRCPDCRVEVAKRPGWWQRLVQRSADEVLAGREESW